VGTHRAHRRRGALVLPLISLLAGGCAGRATPPATASTPSSAAPLPAGELAAAPAAPDPPLPFAHAVRPPSEPREVAEGPVAFVVDSTYLDVYQFDVGRRRFLGPAPRIQGAGRLIPLPGYPTVVGGQSPQGALLVGDRLLVAGGIGTQVFSIPVSAEGLGAPRTIPLDGPGGEPAAGSHFVREVVVTPQGRAVALDEDVFAHTTTAVEIDPVSGATVAHRQLGPGVVAGTAVSAGRLWLAIDAGGPSRLESLGEDLTVLSQMPLTFRPRGLAASGTTLLLTGAAPAALYALDPDAGPPRVLDTTTAGLFGGTVVVRHDAAYWAVPPAGTIREVGLSTHRVRSFAACTHIQDLAVSDQAVIAVCAPPGRITLVDLVTGRSWTGDGGGFPDSVAGPSAGGRPGAPIRPVADRRPRQE
jgi:hypothetical protein